MFSSSPDFQPTCVTRYVRSFDSGAGALLVDTDAGLAYMKALGNPGGPHTLACEFVGTRLASLLGLPTFDHALLLVDEMDELPFHGGESFAEAGTAFATRSEEGTTWGQDARLLNRVENVADISRLVVFDTWVLNMDRYGPAGCRINRDNVFLSAEAQGSGVELRAMDFTHCFTNGRDLTARVKGIEMIRDERVYGLFPEFRKLIDRAVVREMAVQMINLPSEAVQETISMVPKDWSVSKAAREALRQLIFRRSQFVAETIEERLFGGEQTELFSDRGGK